MNHGSRLPTVHARRDKLLRLGLKLSLIFFFWALAIQALTSLYRDSSHNVGFDFYQFWVGGDAVRAHRDNHTPGVLDLYTPEAYRAVGEHYALIARTGSLAERQAAAVRQVLETASSPFFYYVFSVVTPGDYDRAFGVYMIVSLASLIAAIVILGARLGYSLAGIGAALALAANTSAVYSDFHIVNINCEELLICIGYLLMRDLGRRSPRFRVAGFASAGAVMGLLIPFKPNLLLFPALLGVSSLIGRQWKNVFAEAGGFFASFFFAIAISSWSFGGVSCWLAWGRVVHDLGAEPTMPSGYGNLSISRMIYEHTGRNMIDALMGGSIAIAIVAMWIRERKLGVRARAASAARTVSPTKRATIHNVDGITSPQKTVRDADPAIPAENFALPLAFSRFDTRNAHKSATRVAESFHNDIILFGIAACITFLMAGMGWVHYPILIFPILMLAASPVWADGNAVATKKMRYLLASVVVILLMYPPPNDVLDLLPFRLAVSPAIWNHCGQAALLITLGMGLWFEIWVSPTVEKIIA